MDSWERFDEELLPDKEAFYSSLNMKDITDVDYRHAKKVFKNFNDKNLGDYIMICMFRVIHYYLQMYLRILEINVLKFFIHTWISMASMFKKDRNRIRIVN